MKHLIALSLALFGNLFEWLDFWRIWCATACGLLAVVLGYWLYLPEFLPLWPGIVVILFSLAVGILWQRLAEVD